MRTNISEGSAHSFDVVVERDVMATARDGVKLATDIYRPALAGRPAGGRFPAIIERTTCSSSSYRFNPRYPVPTIGGSISVGFEFMAPGGFDTIPTVTR
ncbi:MAG TPA: hypothetical protein VIX59_06575 [Candidatus Binataceae bacterium]